MSRYRSALPQLGEKFFLTDGGIETTLIFHEGLNLPDFAAFDLLKTPEGRASLYKYYSSYAEISRRFEAGLVLESATWRANADWGRKLGYSPESLADANRQAIRLLYDIRNQYETVSTPMVISGCVGPRGDGYVADNAMSADEAEEYHLEQIDIFAGAPADMVCALTMNYVDEAVGIAKAAQRLRMPVVLSFTVETDGCLPNGETLRAAIERVDEATSGYPCYYMINCAHPTHFEKVLTGGVWTERIHGIRANASRMSHAELNEASELDAGNPVELGIQYAALKRVLKRFNVMGGCCGTDQRHIEQIASANLPLFCAVN
ncbi:MAG: homocysteine S-methyltransferase family protein [Nitrospirota bacterium]|nr:homocysteine S-methyltransferase family protein [Nitrospirota bacterium]